MHVEGLVTQVRQGAAYSYRWEPGTPGIDGLRRARAMARCLPAGTERTAVLAAFVDGLCPADRWLLNSSPEITDRVCANLRPDDETAGRLAMAETMHKIIPGVHPVCTREPSKIRKPR